MAPNLSANTRAAGAGNEPTNYAVMMVTFHPLNRTTEAQKLDDDSYPYFWNEEEEAPEKIEAEE